jgi:RHS repeat-associated protein
MSYTELRFTGQREELDDAAGLGLYNYKARFYSTVLGRFLSVDPLVGAGGDPQSWNAYTYVRNNPLRLVDPTGMRWEDGTTPNGFVAPTPLAVRHQRVAAAGGNPQAFEDMVALRVLASTGLSAEIWRRATLPGTDTVGFLNDHVYGNARSCHLCDEIMASAASMVAGPVAGGVRAVAGRAAARAGSEILAGQSASVASGQSTSAGATALRVARVIPSRHAGSPRLAASDQADAFVVVADDVAGLTKSSQLAERLSLYRPDGSLARGPFTVIEFNAPCGIACPIARGNAGFAAGGLTRGGAREFVVPNYRLSELAGVVIRQVR